MSQPNPLRGRIMIVVIALIFIVPFIAAKIMVGQAPVDSGAKTHYGHLITPARPIDYAELTQTPITSPENLAEIKGHWVMVEVTNGPVCTTACQFSQQKTGRLRLMLNKDLARVRRLMLFTGQPDAASTAALAQRDPTLLAAGLSDSLRQRLQEATGAPLADGTVLLLDPLGNAMMWYAPDFNPYGALRDLQRLLRISQIG